MKEYLEISAEEIYNEIVEHKKNLRKYGGIKNLYGFLSDNELYKESIFIKDKAESSFSAYFAKFKTNQYKQRPLLESTEKQDFELLLNGIEAYLRDKNSGLFEKTDQSMDFVYLVGYYADVKLSENKLAKFKKMIIALHKEKDKVELHFFDSRENKIDVAIGNYIIEDQTTIININHKNQRSSQIRLYNPSKSMLRYLGGFGLVIYTSRYNDQVSMQGIFLKKPTAKEAFDELTEERASKVPVAIVPALIEHVLQLPGERNSEFERIEDMKNYPKYARLDSIKGLYIGYHISQTQTALNTLVAIILANGKTILLTDNNEEPYSGYFTFIDDVNIIGRFHYTGKNPTRNYFRFQFNCREEDISKKRLTGTYSGRGATSNEPMAGRILFQKIENIPSQLQNYINEPTEKEQDEINVIKSLKEQKFVKTYLLNTTEKLNLDEEKGVYSILDLKNDNQESFDSVIDFFLGDSDQYIESFQFLEKYLYSLKPLSVRKTKEFEFLKGFYYLYSFEKEGYIQYFNCNPLQILEDGNVKMTKMGSKTQLYTGKAIRQNDRIAFIFTYLNDEEIFPIFFISYIGGVYDTDEFIPTISLSAIAVPNPKASRDFLVKIKDKQKIDKLEDLETYKFMKGDTEIEEKLIQHVDKDTHLKVTEFIHSEFNNIVKSTKSNKGIVKRRYKPWEVFFITALHHAKKSEKQEAIKFLELADQHLFNYYYNKGDEITVNLADDLKTQEIFDIVAINYRGYLNIKEL